MQTRFNCASVYLKIGTVGQIWVEVFHIEFKQNLLSFLWDRGTSPFVVLSRPVARPWTQWAQRVHIRTECSVIHILCVYIYYVYISVKSAFVRTTNQHCNYTTRSITLHKTSCIYTHHYKWVVYYHGGSTEATRGCCKVSHDFSGLIIMFVIDILQIRGACIHPCGYGPCIM